MYNIQAKNYLQKVKKNMHKILFGIINILEMILIIIEGLLIMYITISFFTQDHFINGYIDMYYYAFLCITATIILIPIFIFEEYTNLLDTKIGE